MRVKNSADWLWTRRYTRAGLGNLGVRVVYGRRDESKEMFVLYKRTNKSNIHGCVCPSQNQVTYAITGSPQMTKSRGSREENEGGRRVVQEMD